MDSQKTDLVWQNNSNQSVPDITAYLYFNPLQTCPNTIKEINDILFKFLCDIKGNKMKRTDMINGYEDGGAKMLYYI